MSAPPVGAHLPAPTIRLFRQERLWGGSAFTLPSFDGSRITLNLGDGYRVAPPDLEYRNFLIHELVHAWQWKHMPTSNEYIVDGVVARFQELFEGNHKTYDPGHIGKA